MERKTPPNNKKRTNEGNKPHYKQRIKWTQDQRISKGGGETARKSLLKHDLKNRDKRKMRKSFWKRELDSIDKKRGSAGGL